MCCVQPRENVAKGLFRLNPNTQNLPHFQTRKLSSEFPGSLGVPRTVQINNASSPQRQGPQADFLQTFRESRVQTSLDFTDLIAHNSLQNRCNVVAEQENKSSELCKTVTEAIKMLLESYRPK